LRVADQGWALRLRRRSTAVKRLAALLALALAGFMGPAPQSATSPETPPHLMEGPAMAVLQALAQRDFLRLASFVGPDGLKLSPYVMLDDGDIRLSRSEVAQCGRSRRARLWGSKDGSGEDIRMTCGRYFANYVWDADYRKADEVLTERRQRGLEPNNNHGYVPGAVSPGKGSAVPSLVEPATRVPPVDARSTSPDRDHAGRADDLSLQRRLDQPFLELVSLHGISSGPRSRRIFDGEPGPLHL
jgi:hypothetical protein